jgi:hypothetical protein
MKKGAILLIITLSAFGYLSGQPNQYFPEKTKFNSDIPTPEQFFGYPIGQHHTRYDKIVEYFMLLADLSDRAEFEIFGYSEELRPQIILTISSPSNLTNLDDIQKQHLSLSDPELTVKPDLTSLPLILQLGYNIHGNEASGGEASLLTAYYLVASDEDEMEEILRNSVIFIEPILNPDGRERFTSWVNQNKGYNPVADPSDREHTEAWPGGRTNHYLFDLNRDWLPLSQKESQNRIIRFHKWRPNVITDHHEMGTNSTFFFEPTKQGSENPLVPIENYTKLNRLFASSYAEALNNIDHYYDSGNSFDNSYPGYGSSYADINGGLAILFEQASTRGLQQETDLGYTLKFSTGILNQLTGALTTVRTAIKNQKLLNDYMIRFYGDAYSDAGKDPVKAYVFGEKGDVGRTKEFVKLLEMHQVKVYDLNQNLTSNGISFETGSSYVVPVKQSQYKLIRTMFETNLKFSDSLFYDATAWAMVYSYGMPFSALQKVPSIGNISDSEVTPPQKPAASDYGYLLKWSEYRAPEALFMLQESGLKVKSAWEPFKINSGSELVEFGRGTIFIPVQYQEFTPDRVYSIVCDITNRTQLELFPIETSVTDGQWIGGGTFRSLEKPEILMFAGEGTSSSDFGSLWYLLDKKADISFTRADLSRFSRLDLSRYNTIVMPSGNYSNLTESEVNKLNEWINTGGNLLAFGSAIEFLNSKKIIGVDYIRRDLNLPDRMDYNIVRSETGKHSIGGVFCEVDLDITHPLGFGYTNRKLTVYRDHTTFIKQVEGSSSNVAVYSNNALISGFLTPENSKLLGGSVSLASIRKGRGQITMFIDDPAFRGCWYGTNKLIFNALFFGNTI